MSAVLPSLIAAAVLVGGALEAAPRLPASSAVQAVPAQGSPIDTAGLGLGPYSRARMKLEKTIFKIDVLTVEVQFGQEDARRLAELAGGRGYSRKLADSIAGVAIRSQDAFVRVTFLRNVTLRQFLSGVIDNLRRVPAAGLIQTSDYEMIRDRLPRWFGFLEERGIRKGDQIVYRIRGDTLRTQFRSHTGKSMLDQIDVGPERRLAVLGSYFLPGSDFHKKLVRSLFTTGS